MILDKPHIRGNDREKLEQLILYLNDLIDKLNAIINKEDKNGK